MSEGAGVDLPPVERVQAVGVQPGDVVIVTVPGATHDSGEQVLAVLRAAFPDNKVVVAAAEGTEVAVYRPEGT